MEYTKNYQLPQWVETDRIMMEDFNDMTGKIDEALSEIPGKGNCQIYITSYKGTGGLGINSQNRLTFPGHPMLVCIFNTNAGHYMLMGYGIPGAYAIFDEKICNQVYWEGNDVRWCILDSTTKAAGQMNVAGNTYQVVAFMQQS